MFRYEGLVNGKRRFYEVDVRGRFLFVTTGIVDRTRRPAMKQEWFHAREADEAAASFLAPKLRQGFALVGSTVTKEAPSTQVLPTMAQAILSARDEAGPWLVLADALQAAGDPRGELVVVQEARARRPDDRALRLAEDALFDAYGEALVGRLAMHEEARAVVLSWKYGFLEAATIRLRANHGAEFVHPVRRFDELLRDLYASPSARFLDALVVETRDPFLYGLHVQRILTRKDPPPLRALHVVKNGWGGDASDIDVRDASAYPHLRSLVLHGAIERLDPSLSERLEELELERPSVDVLRTMSKRVWPRLRRLVIGCAALGVRDLAAIADGSNFPSLDALALRDLGSRADVTASIAKGELAPRLRSLELSRQTARRSGPLARKSAPSWRARTSDPRHGEEPRTEKSRHFFGRTRA